MNHIRSSSPDDWRPKELVLFDVDGTILPDIPDELSGRAFWHMVESGLITPNPEHDNLRQLQDLYRAQELTNPRDYLNPLIQTFDESMKGRSRADLNRIASELIEEVYEDAYPEVLDEIHAWQEKGTYIGLISGSPDFLVQALKRKLNADIATGTRYFYQNGHCHYDRKCAPRSKNKHLVAESMLIDLSQNRLRTIGCIALNAKHHRPKIEHLDSDDRFILRGGYGDTINDFSMLDMSDEPIAVAPKPCLQQAIDGLDHWRIIMPHNDRAA